MRSTTAMRQRSMSVPKHHESPVQYETPMKSASKRDQSKDIKKLVDKAVEKALSERENKEIKARKALEERQKELIKSSCQEVRLELIKVEATLSGRLALLEDKVAAAIRSQEDNQRTLEVRIKSIDEAVTKIVEDNKTAIEKERQKRLEMGKKLHKSEQEDMEALSARLEALRTDIEKSKKESKDEMDTLKGNVNGLLLKQYGYLPNSGPAPSRPEPNPIDQLSRRLQEMELKLLDRDECTNDLGDEDPSYRQHSRNSGSGGSRNNRKSSSTSIQYLETRVQNIDDDLQKLTMKVQQISDANIPDGRDKDRDKEKSNEDGKTLKKRLRDLGESTAKACRSLSSGVSDVQQTNLALYTWADQAHIAIGMVSEKLGMLSNPCPPVPTISSIPTTANLRMSQSGYSPMRNGWDSNQW